MHRFRVPDGVEKRFIGRTRLDLWFRFGLGHDHQRARAEAPEYTADEGASLRAVVVDNSSAPAAKDVDSDACDWAG